MFYFGRNEEDRAVSFHVEIWDEIHHARFVVQSEEAGTPAQTSEWMPLGRWHFVEIRLVGDQYELIVNDDSVISGRQPAPNVTHDTLDSGKRYFKIGHFKGYADDIQVRERF